jgi:hypothetical protein
MKSFIDFLTEEAKLQGSKGLPSDYLSDVDIKAQRELGIRKDSPEGSQRYFSDIMRLIEAGRRLTFGNLTPDQQKQRANDLEELAKEVIYSEYGNMLENVDLDIKMVPYGQVSNEMPEISEVPETPASRGQQQSEMQGLEDDEEEEKTSTDAKSSFLDRLFKKPKKKEEFVGSEEYKERVDKAKLINNIIQGEAKNTKKILHSELVKQGLERIFGATAAKDIFKVWDDITKVADKLDWIIPIDQKAGMMANVSQGMAGSVSVDWNEAEENDDFEDDESGDESECPSPRSAEDILKEIENGKDLSDLEGEIDELFDNGNPMIKAIGVDFPMLLHETVKGIYELIAAAYLPSEDAEEKEIKKAKVVKMATTSFEDEAEDFRYGPYIAGALRDFINDCEGSDRYPNMREYVFGRMVLLEAKEFLSLMKGILDKKDSAKKQIEEMISEIIDEIREYEIEMIDEPEDDLDYGSDYEEDDLFAGEDEEDEIEKLIRQTAKKEQEVEGDYSKMSKRELQELIDAALDSGDFETLKKIQPFMKESLEWRIYESEIKKILK